VYDAKEGVWKRAGRAAGEGAGASAAREAGEVIGERWLGPKILDAGGKVLRVAQPILHILTAVDVARLGGAAASSYIDFLNQPFAKEQADKKAARELGEEFAKRLAELAAADPNAVITADGRKFDPKNPRDLEELLQGLSQNLSFGRKPFDGLMKYFPKVPVSLEPTSFMGPAAGDTAQATTLDAAWRLIQTAIAAEKSASAAATECIREQSEAQSQLQTALTFAGVRAVAESDVATVPESANDVKAQTAAVRAQSRALQAAYEQMRTAVDQTDGVATKICDLAAQAALASADEIKKWRAESTADLFAATNVLNAAQAKIEGVNVAVDQLRTSTAALEGFQTSLTLYKIGSGAAEAANASPDAPFAAAKAAAQRASAARDKLAPLLEQLRSIPPQITKMLAPYIRFDIEAAAMDAAARQIGTGIEQPSLVDLGALIMLASPTIEAALNNQKSVESAIGRVNLDSIISAAHDAITEAENLRTGASAIAATPERYRALQNASQCFAMIKFSGASEVAATESPTAAAAPDEDVVVPSLAGFGNVSEMKTALAHAGLAGAFSSKGKPPSKEMELKFAGQSPAADTKVKRGSTVSVSIYQQFEDASAQASATPAAESDEVLVPSLAAFDNVSEMKVALAQSGLVGAFSAKGTPPSKEMEFKFAGQSPAADTKVKRGSTVSVSIYQKYDDTANAAPTAPPLGPTGSGTMPSLIGLTIDQATTRLTSNMRIGGDEVGDKPPTPEKAYTIYAHSPAANTKIAPDQKVVVTVKRYGSAKEASADPSGDIFVGTWEAISAEVDGKKAEGKADPTQKASVMEISRKAGGYVATGLGPQNPDGKPADLDKGVVENGRLGFKVDIDMGKVVGMQLGDTNLMESQASPEETTMRMRWTLTPEGDNLVMEFLLFEPGSKVASKDKLKVTYRRR
jgi:beta-lactam-binding protein with PASTA domain